MIKLYNTLSRQKEEFKPIKKGEAGIYTCGPTVYNYAHLGNLRAYIFEDILKRVLRYNGYKVKHVMNITDVGHLTGDRDMGEDKLEKGARREGKNAWEIAEFYTAAFKHDLELLNITEPDIWCKATDNIPEQIALIKKLEEKGYTYRTSDGIYFDTAKFKDYNKLSHLDLETLREGARVEKNDEKKNPTDFALWKFSEPHPDPDCPKITVIPAKACPTASARTGSDGSFGRAGTQKKHLAKVKLCGDDEFLSPENKSKRQMEWESPWGIGFPGWHIECSAMSLKFLKDQLDIHCGGIDHINVHHTNEIAQSEAATGKKFFNFWLHGAFLNIAGGKKMAKSEDNFLTLENALIKKGIGPLVYRFAVLETHYRKPMEYGEEIMKNAENGLRHLLNQVNDLGPEKGKINGEFKNKFKEAVSDDLNMPQALAIAQDLLKSNLPAQDKLATVLYFDEVLGLRLDKLIRESAGKELPENVKLLSEKREEARGKKDWAEADRLRAEIEKLGYTVDDTKEGMRIFKK